MDVEWFQEKLWEIVVEFGEPILMGIGLDKEASALQNDSYPGDEAKHLTQIL